MIDGTVMIDDKKLIVESTIAEGGFGYVHKVRDPDSNNYYALKKINSADKETQSEIENEIDIMRSLQKHPHIMEFIAYTKFCLGQNGTNQDNNQSSNGSAQPKNHSKFTYLILCEYCDRGTLAELELPIQELERSCRIIYQLSSAIKHMHEYGIIHRDIKAENVLFDKDGRVKLCDFGSSTRKKYEPNIGWTPLERATVEEEMQRHTTPLYRPPEILETYLHYPIDCTIDIWALGCLIYFIRFGQHAFPDSGKLSIVNCCYSIPKDVSESDPLVSIIRQCIKPDPKERISIQSLMNSFEVEFENMDLNGSIVPFVPKSSNQDPMIQQNDGSRSGRSLTEESAMGQTQPQNQLLSSATSSPKMSSSPVEAIGGSGLTAASVSREDTLIDLANTTSSSTSSFETSKKPTSATSNVGARRDLLKNSGLTDELLGSVCSAPTKSANNIDTLLDMDGFNIGTMPDQKILSPKKACPVGKSNPNGKRDAFDDLLESFGANLPSNGLSSNNKSPIIGVDSSYDGFGIDPKLKILEWRDSRRGNIRALLSSLHMVLSDEFRWKPIGMHQLVTDTDVKKVYRSACLTVHPDKVTNCNEDTKEVAKMVFTELNEAWTKFRGLSTGP